MNMVLLGKLLVGGSAAAGASVFTLWQTGVIGKQPTESIVEDPDIVVYGITTEVSNNKATEKTKIEEPKNFQCKMTTEFFDCDLELITISATNNHISITKTDPKTPDASIDANKLTSSNNVFKITAKKSKMGNWLSNNKTEIEVIRVKSLGNAETSEHQYSKMNILFSIDEEGEFYGKTKYFVGKAEKSDNTSTFPTSLTAADNKDCQCSWSDSESFADCSLKAFETKEDVTGFSDIKFPSSSSKDKVIENTHYLIYLNQEQAIEEFNEDSIIYANIKSTESYKIKLTNLHRVVMANDKLLVLGPYKTTS